MFTNSREIQKFVFVVLVLGFAGLFWSNEQVRAENQKRISEIKTEIHTYKSQIRTQETLKTPAEDKVSLALKSLETDADIPAELRN